MQQNHKLVMGFVAHVDTGKTTLSESVLFNSGAIKKLGRVDSKDTFLDTDLFEKERGITIYSKDARFQLGNKEIVLVDTPGHVDFSTEMERVLPILDVAVLLISGSSGIQSHTKTLWSLLKRYDIPVFIFVNKMDMPDCDKDKLMTNIKAVLSDSAIDFSSDNQNEFYENIATTKEEYLNDYLEKGTISDSDISSSILAREIFPVYFGSALKNEGIIDFINGLNSYLPNIEHNTNGPFGAFTYKISYDEQGKRLSHLKIMSGTLSIKDYIGEEKVNDIRIYSGSKYTSVSSVEAGDLCVVQGLNDTHIKDTYGTASKSLSSFLTPALNYAVHFTRDFDTNSMLEILKKLEDEDPSLNVFFNEQTKEIQVSLMGDIQAEVLQRTLREKYNAPVKFTEGKVVYKETIVHQVEGVGHFEPLRHYSEVHLKIEPLELGSGIQYECNISEDLLAQNWQRLILTHLTERAHKGVLTGAPLTDIKYTLVSGRAHNKHTEGGDFRQATYRAIRQGLMVLKSIGACRLLEPYYNYTLTLPSEHVGRAMTDINQLSGSCEITETDNINNITVLCGKAPVSTMNSYIKEVNAYTRGLGQLSYTLAGYDLCHNEDDVLLNTNYNPDADIRNPSSSVFCSHGAGTVIPWDEVPEYMHISYASSEGALGTDFSEISDLTSKSENEEIKNANRLRRFRESNSDISISLEEIDNILHASTHANEKGRQGSYKGISASLREYRRNQSQTTSSKTEYKGTAQKQKYILIDGYNLIHAWNELNDIARVTLDGAAGRLNDIICSYQAIVDIPIMVVYDAYKVKGHSTEIIPFNNITIVYTKEAQTADQYIEKYAHDNSKKYDITVVTSDGLEQVVVLGNGGHIVSSREFQLDVSRSFRDFNERHNVSEEY